MSLFDKVSEDLKAAMKARDAARTRAMQGIKAELLKLRTEKGASSLPSADDELKALQKMAKQRRDSLDIFVQQNREDLAQKEREELEVIETFLPKQLSADEVRAVLQEIIAETGATGPADTGKVMPHAMKRMAGKADGKLISQVLREMLG